MDQVANESSRSAMVRAMEESALRAQVRCNDEATADVVRMFHRAGLDLIVLKGPGTRRLLGARGARRPSSDVDVLIKPGQRGAASRLLSREGYRCTRGVHADSWIAENHPPIDLHWTVARISVAPKRLWAAIDREFIHIGDMDVPVPQPALTFVHLAIHVTQNGSDRPREDLQVALKQMSEEEIVQAVALARALGVATSVAWALTRIGERRAAAHFGTSRLEPNTVKEMGAVAFLRSDVYWRERYSRLARNLEHWLLFQMRRIRRFLNGTSATNHRWNETRRRVAQS